MGIEAAVGLRRRLGAGEGARTRSRIEALRLRVDATGNLVGDGDRVLVPSEAAGFFIDVAALCRCAETTVYRAVNYEPVLEILQKKCLAGGNTWGFLKREHVIERLYCPGLEEASSVSSLSALLNRVKAGHEEIKRTAPFLLSRLRSLGPHPGPSLERISKFPAYDGDTMLLPYDSRVLRSMPYVNDALSCLALESITTNPEDGSSLIRYGCARAGTPSSARPAAPAPEPPDESSSGDDAGGAGHGPAAHAGAGGGGVATARRTTRMCLLPAGSFKLLP